MRQFVADASVSVLLACACGMAFLPLPYASAGQGADSKTATGVEWGKEVNGVRCALTLPNGQKTLPLGQKITLSVLTKNFGDGEIHTAEGSPFAAFKIRLEAPDGKAAPLSADGRRHLIVAEDVGVTNTVKVDPGMVRETKLHLSDLYDMKQQGQYRITIDRIFYTPDGRDSAASTNTTTITLAEVKAGPK